MRKLVSPLISNSLRIAPEPVAVCSGPTTECGDAWCRTEKIPPYDCYNTTEQGSPQKKLRGITKSGTMMFQNTLLDSKFSLTPAGGGPHSYRLLGKLFPITSQPPPQANNNNKQEGYSERPGHVLHEV
eukprot:7262039-Pyramimonas_sp.AAC.1